MTRKYALLVPGTRVGNIQVRGIFETAEEAEEFADEELASEVAYEIQGARYY